MTKIKKAINRQLRVYRYVFYKETLIDFKEHFWSFLGSFIGIASIAFLSHYHFSGITPVFLIGSFGASAVLVYGAIQSPLAQPRNLVLGHVVSAIIGVSIAKLIPDVPWLAAALAVSLSIVGMQMARCLHPPGGATALIAVSGGTQITSLGYCYVLFPVLTGALLLLLIALFFNNITKNRHYPVKRSRLRRSRRRELKKRFQ